MKGKKFVIVAVISVLLNTACQKDIPKPENKVEVMATEQRVAQVGESIPVNNLPKRTDPFFVQTQINGKDVYIECMIKGISFRNEDSSKAKIGKIIVSIDGKRKQEVAAAAFIIKGLTSGEHTIRLDVVNLAGKPYELSKEFTISIQ